MKISIYSACYNHAAFIDDTIRGILSQEGDFEYEIWLHDDCSTDGSQEILKRWEAKYPEIIHVIYEKTNTYPKDPFPKILPKMQGKYVAICDCDDYWIDPNKLQLQCNYMDAHEDCSICTCNEVGIDYMSNQHLFLTGNFREGILKPEDILKGGPGFIQPASFLIRKNIMVKDIKRKDSLVMKYGFADYPLRLLALSYGNIYFFDRVMAAYRFRRPGSYTAGKRSFAERINTIKLLYDFYIYAGMKYKESIDGAIYLFIWEEVFRPEDNGMDETKKIEKAIDNVDEAIKPYFEYMERARQIMLSDDDLLSAFRRIAKDSDTIYIYGAGFYGKKLADRLQSVGIKIKGFIVSSKGRMFTKSEKETIKVYSDSTVLAKQVGDNPVLCGMNPANDYEIRDNLSKYRNVYYPFREDLIRL